MQLQTWVLDTDSCFSSHHSRRKISLQQSPLLPQGGDTLQKEELPTVHRRHPDITDKMMNYWIKSFWIYSYSEN